MAVKWKPNGDEQFPPYHGFDEEGNEYWMSANREVVEVRLTDGRYGIGWTEEQALQSARGK